MVGGQSWSCAYILYFFVTKIISRLFLIVDDELTSEWESYIIKTLQTADSSLWCHCGLVDKTWAVLIAVLESLAAVSEAQGELHHCCIIHGVPRVPRVLMCVSARDVKAMCSAAQAVYGFGLSLVCDFCSTCFWVHTCMDILTFNLLAKIFWKMKHT